MTESPNPLAVLGPFVAIALGHPALALGAAFLLPLVIALAYLALRPPPATPAPLRPSEAAPVGPEAEELVRRPPAPLPAEAAPVAPRGLRERLARTSQALIGRIEGMIGGRALDAQLLDELESLLFTADLGVKTAESLLESVRQQASGADLKAVHRILRGAILAKLKRVEPAPGSTLRIGAKPHVILVLGVNGSGKTTTIGKLASRHAALGRKVVLGAADTFRAAAIEQLQAWGERTGATVIAGRPGADPSAVAFDALKAAVARGADVAIIDTAGRLQTKLPLLEELKKIVRVMEREVAGAPHESLLVLDANTGQNALSQARVFTSAGRVTALALTKLDGTAKGGVIVGLADELGIPVKFVGVGEGVEDLRDFSAEEFVAALFDERAGGEESR
jgi:fused signal recognition particle receptor